MPTLRFAVPQNTTLAIAELCGTQATVEIRGSKALFETAKMETPKVAVLSLVAVKTVYPVCSTGH